MKKKKEKEVEEQQQGWISGWKSIADFCDCDEKTLKKKVKHGLPVYRESDKKPTALPNELNEWLKKFKKY